MNKTITPGARLLSQVRAGFVSQGGTLHQWCKINGILYPNARQALMGTWNGLKGRQLRELIVRESGFVGDREGV